MKTLSQAIFDAGMVEELALKKEFARVARTWTKKIAPKIPQFYDSPDTDEYLRRFDSLNSLVHVPAVYCEPCDFGDDDDDAATIRHDAHCAQTATA